MDATIKSQHYHAPVTEELVTLLASPKVLSVLDAKHAFCQLILDEPS